ncbi:unnamed protein product [Meloidogyne enterolobii]|uniref:Uncharacterized protein n=1 Tax=Meloidogyne enterolobii TaxID=390850 RepID=A0ACB0Y084_MELEN
MSFFRLALIFTFHHSVEATSCDQAFNLSAFLKQLMLYSIVKEICAADLVAPKSKLHSDNIRRLLDLISSSEAIFRIDCSEKRRIRNLTTFMFSGVTAVTGQTLRGWS